MRREKIVVVIASDEVNDCLLGASGDAMWMDVTLASLSRLWRETPLRDGEDELGRELHRVHELALGGPRVDGQAANRHAHRGGREGLHLELADIGAVEGVRDVCAERPEIEVFGSAT